MSKTQRIRLISPKSVSTPKLFRDGFEETEDYKPYEEYDNTINLFNRYPGVKITMTPTFRFWKYPFMMN